MSVISLDVDLLRIHAFASDTGRVCYNSASVPWNELLNHKLVLMEVASPVFYCKTRGEIVNRFKWAIFNSMIAGQIAEFTISHNLPFLVSPSSKWTLGHPEAIRHEIAGVKSKEHDLRECECMQYYYQTNPEQWEPFEEYKKSLSTRKEKN